MNSITQTLDATLPDDLKNKLSQYQPLSYDELRKIGAREAKEELAANVYASKQFAIKNALDRAAIPLHFSDKSFSNYQSVTPSASRTKDVCKRFADKFNTVLKNGTCMMLTGRTGTGKTHLACAVANQLAHDDKQYSPLYVTASDIARRIKDSWKTRETESSIINLFTKPDLLIIDEIGVQYGSDTEVLLLTEILNKRYGENKPVMIISNWNASEVSELLGERIASRFAGTKGVSLVCDWEDFRRNGGIKKSSDALEMVEA